MPSVCLSVCDARAVWLNGRIFYQSAGYVIGQGPDYLSKMMMMMMMMQLSPRSNIRN